jgi:hypothetical protein
VDLFSSDLVRPLETAENHFLEVLVSQFSICRRGQGSELSLCFDSNIPAIWTRHAKGDVKRMIPEFARKAAIYQNDLDAFLLKSEGDSYDFNDSLFPFRYASGGTLPIMRIGEKEYYCLLYRDIFPVGWNIANGGCDNKNELLNPVDTIERELREELIVADPKSKKRYAFEADAGKPLDRAEFAVARRYWQEHFGSDLPIFDEIIIPLKWLEGPDFVTVRYASDEPQTHAGIFLNINAEDYGIEVDKIAKINFDEDAILCDGEVIGDRLVNAPVGLFGVDRLNREVADERTEFLPDYFFYNARRYEGRHLERVITRDFLPYIDSLRTQVEIDAHRSTEKKFDLCPVTRRIIKRYLAIQSPAPVVPFGHFDVFISFAKEDRRIARAVFEFLRQKKIKIFLSEETVNHPDFLRAIDNALDKAECLVVVGTSVNNLRKPSVEYEWRSFCNDILNRRKTDTRVVSFISGFSPLDLPRPLRVNEAIVFDPERLRIGLRKLNKYMPTYQLNKGMANTPR